MTSQNPNVVLEAPVVENEAQLESELSNKLEIGQGSKHKPNTRTGNKILLKTSDGEVFEIDEAIAVQSQTIAHVLEDGCANTEIPLLNVTGPVLVKVIEYCKKHVCDCDEEELKKWDVEFMEMEQSMIFDLILASSYLDVSGLLDLSSQTIADMIAECKSRDEIRERFGIVNDFTPDEVEEIRRETQWAFE